MNSMKIGTYQMDTTFGLYLPEYTIPAPAIQTNFVKIIGRDGSVDLSNALGLHYDSRTWSLDFKCFDPTVNWHTLSSQVMNAIHGKRLNFEFDDDPNYFWTGRVSVQNYVSSHGTGTLKVTIVSDPFKYAKLSTIVTKTASTGTDYTGALVTFNTANAKINDLSVTMQPIQDLHGYSSPWPAGGGKNKFNSNGLNYYSHNGIDVTEVNGHLYLTGTAGTGNSYFSVVNLGLTSTTGFTWSANNPATNSGVHVVFRDANSYFGDAPLNSVNKTISVSTATSCDSLIIYVTAGTTLTDFEISPQLEIGSTATAWTPYSNICPITGRTGLSVYRTWKNLFDQTSFAWRQNWTIVYASLQIPNGTYTFSTDMPANTTRDVFIIPGQVSSGADSGTNGVCAGTPRTITVTDGYYTLATRYNSVRPRPSNYNWQLELGTTATAYEPYNGNTYAVDWTSEAGTVYGGTLDVVTGVLTVDKAKTTHSFALPTRQDLGGRWIMGFYLDNALTDLLNKQWEVSNPPLKNLFSVSNLPIIREGLLTDTDYATVSFFGHASGVEVRPRFMASHFSAEEAQAIANEMEVVYPINPIEITLTPQEVETLVGTNNVWSDGGNVTVAVVTPETLTNNGRAVVPTLTASADMVLKWGNYSASVQQGTSTIPQLILENGANLVYIIGTGSISFTWQEESL